jgi:hypothetical protein
MVKWMLLKYALSNDIERKTAVVADLMHCAGVKEIQLKLSVSDKCSWRCSIGECCCMISRGYIQL